MVVVVTGGGSGGHITPILAVAHELKKLRKDVEIVYIGQKGDSLADVPAKDPNIDRVVYIRAGKLRRYHGEGWRQLLDLPTVVKNVRDVFYTLAGTWQSIVLLGKLRPSVVFVKGGFIGVPVGFAAALRRVPYVTHDSDAIPGLANRLIAPWAAIHGVAMPKEVYAYPQEKTISVGVPISHQYHPLSTKKVADVRIKLDLNTYKHVVLVTGGSLGAERINDAIADCAPHLLGRYPDMAIVHLAGRGKDQALRRQYASRLSPDQQKHVIIRDFVSNFYEYSGAADVVIARAGGTNLAELAAQAKACVIVPSPFLAGGHQLKNAKVLEDRKAIKVVDEDKLVADHLALMPPLVDLLDDPQKVADLGKRLGAIEHADAAQRLAVVLLEQATKK